MPRSFASSSSGEEGAGSGRRTSLTAPLRTSSRSALLAAPVSNEQGGGRARAAVLLQYFEQLALAGGAGRSGSRRGTDTTPTPPPAGSGRGGDEDDAPLRLSRPQASGPRGASGLRASTRSPRAGPAGCGVRAHGSARCRCRAGGRPSARPAAGRRLPPRPDRKARRGRAGVRAQGGPREYVFAGVGSPPVATTTPRRCRPERGATTAVPTRICLAGARVSGSSREAGRGWV